MAGGCPFKYDREKHFDKIMDAVPKVLTRNMVAGLCKLPTSTFKDWIRRGEEDLEAHLDTPLAELSSSFKEAQNKYVQDSLDVINTMPKNWQARAWILERCFREEFGQDSSQIRELIDLVNQLSKKLIEQQK